MISPKPLNPLEVSGVIAFVDEPLYQKITSEQLDLHPPTPQLEAGAVIATLQKIVDDMLSRPQKPVQGEILTILRTYLGPQDLCINLLPKGNLRGSTPQGSKEDSR